MSNMRMRRRDFRFDKTLWDRIGATVLAASDWSNASTCDAHIAHWHSAVCSAVIVALFSFCFRIIIFCSYFIRWFVHAIFFSFIHFYYLIRIFLFSFSRFLEEQSVCTHSAHITSNQNKHRVRHGRVDCDVEKWKR